MRLTRQQANVTILTAVFTIYKYKKKIHNFQEGMVAGWKILLCG